MTKIDKELVRNILESKSSDANSHEPHDENNLCDSCMIKRELWDIEEFMNLNLALALLNLSNGMRINPGCLAEAMSMGFELGKSYAESIELNRLMSETKTK